MSSTDRNQNADNIPAETKGLLASVGETLSHAKDQLVSSFTKNEEAVKEEYHEKKADNADNLVDQAKHKGEEWQHGINKNVESMKEEYHDQARQDNQDRAMEKAENMEPKGWIQSAVDTLYNIKDQAVSSLSGATEAAKESYSNERMNDSSNLANKDSELERKEQSSRVEEESQNKGLIRSAVDSLYHKKDEIVASFNKNLEAAKEGYYKEKSDNDNNLVDQAKDKVKEWDHSIQKNKETVKEDFHREPKGDESKKMAQDAADKLSHMKDEAVSTLNKNAEAAKEEYYSQKADHSSDLIDKAANKGKEWEHKAKKNMEATKEEFHSDA